MKINKSQIARELEVDRRTVDKYINGYTKPETRNCDDCITPFYDIITELLSDKNQQVFYYRKVLWQYLVDNHGFKGVYCNFCHYLRKYPEFDSYFRKNRPSNTNKVTVRYETPMGKQAQLDWKESIPFILSSGEIIEVNILSCCFHIQDSEYTGFHFLKHRIYSFRFLMMHLKHLVVFLMK